MTCLKFHILGYALRITPAVTIVDGLAAGFESEITKNIKIKLHIELSIRKAQEHEHLNQRDVRTPSLLYIKAEYLMYVV